VKPGEDRAVRVLRRAVRGRRLSRPQAAALDRLPSSVANEDVALLALAGLERTRAEVGDEHRPHRPGRLPSASRALPAPSWRLLGGRAAKLNRSITPRPVGIS
jgi:hypothetical protein